jgi:hypothetical protein
MGLYSISISTELAFYGPSASQVLPCMRCIFPLLYFTVYEGYSVLYILAHTYSGIIPQEYTHRFN